MKALLIIIFVWGTDGITSVTVDTPNMETCMKRATEIKSTPKIIRRGDTVEITTYCVAK